MTAPKPKPTPAGLTLGVSAPDPPEPGPDDEPDTIDELTIDERIANVENVRIRRALASLWVEIKALDERMRAPPIPIGKRP